MDGKRIEATLRARFAAPLPEFQTRRIVFWRDEEREFEAMLDELSIPDVKLVRLTGHNNFAVKKLLLHDDLSSSYLIYDPLSYAAPQDDWLLDIRLYSEEYRADKTSLQMAELGVEPTPAMRKTMKLYHRFFESRERTAKLCRIGHSYQTPLQLHVDVMAVLAGARGGTAQDVFIAVLSGGLNEEENLPLINIQKFGSIDAFWQLVRKYTGYIYESDKPLGFFAAHVLLTALAHTMGDGAVRGLERFLSESNTAYCYSVVYEWRSSERRQELYELCRTVERELQLSARFGKLSVEQLLRGDVFPAIDESILAKCYDEISERVVRTELLTQVVENRRTSGWYSRFADYYGCLVAVGQIQTFYQENAGGFFFAQAKDVWNFYVEQGYRMDAAYRRFHFAFGNTLKDGDTVLEDKLKHAAGYVESLYRNWYLTSLTDCWVRVSADDLASLGYVSEVPRQRDFYRHYVQPIVSKGARAFVIISDALRYETAVELQETISRSTKGTAVLEYCQAQFPSITKFGMAALLPGEGIAVTEDMEVLRAGMPTRSTVDRQRVLMAVEPNSVAVQYQELLAMKRAERRALTTGQRVVYIYHNTIDAIGDKTATESKVFAACYDAIQELTNLLRIVVNDLQGTDILITADHGFLYTYKPLSESDKVDRTAFHGEIYEVDRRYALTAPDTAADYLLPVRLEKTVFGVTVGGLSPRDATRIKIAGGGENYVHGGVSLQELVVPILTFKNLRTASKGYVETSTAELKLLTQSRKITNLIFSLDFFQRQPVSEKMLPCTYNVYMADETGAPISDRQTVIADRSALNDSERVFRVRLHLKSATYNKNKTYRLVITNGVDFPTEEDFQIDIAFADDFGFDL